MTKYMSNELPDISFHICQMVQFTKKSVPAQKLFSLFDRFVINHQQGVDPDNQTPCYIKGFVYSKVPKFQTVPIKKSYGISPICRPLEPEQSSSKSEEGREGTEWRIILLVAFTPFYVSQNRLSLL